MSEVRNPHDACFQALMQQPEHARAFFQHYLAPAWQTIVDLDTLVLASGTHVTTELKKLHTDILYRVDLRDPDTPGASAYLHTIVEHQSTPDPAMSVRLLQYKASLLRKHVQEAHLPPIHTMVLYHGDPTPYPYKTTSFCAAASLPSQNLLDLPSKSTQIWCRWRWIP